MADNDNIEIGKRLKECATKKFGERGQAAYARLLGISPTLFGDYCRGRMKPGNKLQERLRDIGENVEYIMTGVRKPIIETNIIPAKGRMYKVIISVNAGDPEHIFREENYTGEEVFFAIERERAFSVKVIGDSMQCNNAKTINPGDYVLVDMDAAIFNGDVIVVNLRSGRQMIKQFIQGENDEIILRSFNPDHPDIVVKQYDVITMFRIIAAQSQRRF